MPTLTDNELRAIAYYAVGVTSEGKDVAYRLSFAGNHLHEKDGTVLLKPIGNSGYSVGEMQTDLGQHHDDAKALVNAYQDWAKANHPGTEAGWVLSDAQQAEQAAKLGRDGHHIRDPEYDAHDRAYRVEHHTHIPSRLLPVAGPDIDPTFRSHFDTFLATDTGKAAVHRLDVREVNQLVDAVAKPLRDNVAFYQNATPEEQAKIFAATAKVYNQSQTRGLDLLAELRHGEIKSLADIESKINEYPGYMQTGRDAALAGAGLFNALQDAGKDNSMRAAWRGVTSDPLADLAKAVDPRQPHPADQRAAVKGLFVQPEQGQAMVAALETGGSYNYGDPAKAHSRGFYAQGRDFLQWDRNGHGHAFIGGEWSAFSRNDISLTRNHDHTLDVELARDGQTQRLLHVTHPQHHANPRHAHETNTGVLQYGARGEAVAALQTELATLGYTDRHGHALQADGDFGRDTLHAVEAFQRDHGLTTNGQVDPRTQAALRTAADARKMEASVVCDVPAPLMTFSDPDHPQHALQATLRELLPATTTEARLAQATAACHAAGINKPEDLSGIYSGGDGKILFSTSSLFANMAEMDISKPAPAIQQSLQQVQQFDQPQQMQTQQTTQQQAVQGPVMHY